MKESLWLLFGPPLPAVLILSQPGTSPASLMPVAKVPPAPLAKPLPIFCQAAPGPGV